MIPKWLVKRLRKTLREILQSPEPYVKPEPICFVSSIHKGKKSPADCLDVPDVIALQQTSFCSQGFWIEIMMDSAAVKISHGKGLAARTAVTMPREQFKAMIAFYQREQAPFTDASEGLAEIP